MQTYEYAPETNEEAAQVLRRIMATKQRFNQAQRNAIQHAEAVLSHLASEQRAYEQWCNERAAQESWKVAPELNGIAEKLETYEPAWAAMRAGAVQ